MSTLVANTGVRFRMRLRADAGPQRSEWYASRWRAAADECRWRVSSLGGAYLSLEGPRVRIVVSGADTSLDAQVTYRLAGAKALCGSLLERAGIPTPALGTFDVTDIGSIREALRTLGDRAVIKPAAGSGGGAGITVHPRGPRLIARALVEAAAFGRRIAIQERIDGQVVRVLVLDGEVLDAVHRSPAAVTGDGRSTIGDLIARENDRRRSLWPMSTGIVGATADRATTLASQRLSTRSVPPQSARIAVSQLSNTGSELDSLRVSLGGPASEMAVSAAAAIGVRLAGVDVVLDDDGSPLAVLEVNTGPGLHWHVLVRDHPYDPFAAILSRLDDS